MLLNDASPIIAIATGTGNAGIGILRISGSDDDVTLIMNRIFPNRLIKNRYATLLPVYDRGGERIDQGIILYFQAPHSYTGESVLEIQIHGGRAVLEFAQQEILYLAREFKLRKAYPGEFTERAFLNGKIDLIQAEAIADIIEASSKSSVRAATRSLSGDFSKLINKLNDDLITLRIEIEAILDFPEEEIDFINKYQIDEKLDQLINKLNQIINNARQGEVLRDGLRVALIGETNVGKSSLLNILAGEDVAIVSDVAGTTRDRIQTTIILDGIPFHFVDTAGIRETSDKVERIGISRSKEEIEKADVVIQVLDITQQSPDENKRSLDNLLEKISNKGVPIIQVFNKADLQDEPKVLYDSRGTSILTSVKTGYGIERLKNHLLKISGVSNLESVFSARERHIELLIKTKDSIERAKIFVVNNSQLEFAAEELREASDKLGEIVGRTTPDDLLGKIFSGFCIGK